MAPLSIDQVTNANAEIVRPSEFDGKVKPGILGIIEEAGAGFTPEVREKELVLA